jgi:hypothetical protein
VQSLQAGRVIGLLALFLLFATAVRAQVPEGVTLDWRTGSECTSPLDLEWQIARLLGPEIVVPEPLAFLAEVSALPAGRYALTLNLARGERRTQRKVELDSCPEVQDAVALLVAITLDPKAAIRAREAAPEKTPPEPLRPPPAVTEPAPPRAPDPPREPRRLSIGLTVGAIGDVQTLPGLTAGPSLGTELSVERFRVWLEGHYFTPRYAQAASSDVEARVELTAGSAGMAYVADFGPIGLGPTLAAEFGYLRAVGSRLEDRRVTGTLWAAGLAGVRLDVQLHSRVGLRLGAAVGVPLRRPQLGLFPEPIFYRTSAVTGRIELSMLIRLGSRP